MSRAKRRAPDTGLKAYWRRSSSSQKLVFLLSLMVAISMVVSLVLVSLPESRQAEPTAAATDTVAPAATATTGPAPAPTRPLSTSRPTVSATPNPTEPMVGPVLPSATPTTTSTLTATPAALATPRAEEARFTFAVCGDSRGNPTVYKQVLASVADSASTFLIHAGDMVNAGEEGQWREFAQIMKGFSLPFYPVPGNHDGLAGKLDNYLVYSGGPAAHYSLAYGPIHFAFVDSHNGGVSNSELNWLRQDLSGATQPLKVVVLHHPAFDPEGSDHIMAFGNAEFMALMKEQAVDYVFAGHIHAYAQRERDGVVYVYSGGAGAPLRTGGPPAYYHYLLVTVDGEKVTVQVVKI